MTPRAINIARAEDVLGKPKATETLVDGIHELAKLGHDCLSERKDTSSRPRDEATGGMNKTEARFKREVLDGTDGVLHVVFAGVKLRLADRTWYTPDFVVWTDAGVHVWEIKGSWKSPHQEDSRVKLKVAAELYPQFTFFAAVPERDTGGWDIEEIPCRARS